MPLSTAIQQQRRNKALKQSPLQRKHNILVLDLLSLGSASSSQSLLGTVQSVSVVTTELWVNTLQGWVLVGLWLLDTVLVGLLGLVMGCVILGLGHFCWMLVCGSM